MAQIPTYKSQTGLAGGSGAGQLNVPGGLQEAAAAPANALATLGKTGLDMSVKFYAQQKAIERENILSEKYENFLIGDKNNKGFNLLKADAMAQGDTNALNNFKFQSDNYYNQVLSTIDDDVVKRAFKDKYTNAYSSNFIDVQSQVYQNNIDKGKSTIAQNINNHTNEYVNGINAATKEKGFNNIAVEIDKGIELGILSGNNRDALIYKYHEIAYKTELKNQLSSNPQKVLEAINSGEFNKLINPEDLSTIKNSAIVALNKNQKEAITNLTTQGDMIEDEVKTDIESLELYVSPDLDVLTSNAQKLAELDQKRIANGKAPKYENTITDLEDAMYAYTFVETVKNGTIAEGQNILNSINDEIKKNEGTSEVNNSLIKARDKVTDLITKMRTDSIDNNNQLQTDLGNPPIPDVDFFSNPEQFAFDAQGTGNGSYIEVVTNNANRMDMDKQYFTKNQILAIDEKLKTANYDEVLNFLTNMGSLAGTDTVSALNNFKNLSGKGNEGLAHIGMLIAANDGNISRSIESAIKGYVSYQDNTNKQIIDQVPDKWKLEYKNQYFNTAINDNQMNGVKEQILRTADYIFNDKILNSKYKNEISNADPGEYGSDATFDPDSDLIEFYTDSIQEAAGRVQRGNEFFGGMIEQGDGNWIIIPDTIENFKDAEDLMDMLEDNMDETLFDEGTFVIRQRVDMPGNLETSDDEFFADFSKVPFAHIDGQAIAWTELFEDKESIYFSNYEEANGVYYIHFGNPNEPGTKRYTDEKGNDVLFDLKGIYPRLFPMQTN